MKQSYSPRRGFSLIELVIVVVIIAIIAAIAIPKMSRAATGASESALSQDLSQVRSAIDMFAAEHNGAAPSSTIATFTTQLTGYSDSIGTTVSATKTTSCIYGPYIKAIPSLPIGTNKGYNGVTGTAGTANFGWSWDGTSFLANTASGDKDSAGTAYNTY